jgi:hypothetical protein
MQRKRFVLTPSGKLKQREVDALVREWWRGRVEDGCQLAHPERFWEAYDYKGKERWKRKVAAYALWQDFCLSGHDRVPYMAFTFSMRRVVPGLIGRHALGRISEKGRCIRVVRRLFYNFRAVNDELNEKWSENVKQSPSLRG